MLGLERLAAWCRAASPRTAPEPPRIDWNLHAKRTALIAQRRSRVAQPSHSCALDAELRAATIAQLAEATGRR